MPQKSFQRQISMVDFFQNLGILLIAEAHLVAFIQNWNVLNNFLCINNIVFKLVWAETIYITFNGKRRLSWGSSRKFSIEWVITTSFEISEYSQNRLYEVSIGFLGCWLLKNNIDMVQWLNWSETPDPSTIQVLCCKSEKIILSMILKYRPLIVWDFWFSIHDKKHFFSLFSSLFFICTL